MRRLKLPSFLVAMATGITLWMYLLQQSTEILTAEPQNLSNPPFSSKNSSHGTPQAIKIVPHFQPEEEHSKIVEQRLEFALQQNELKRREFKFDSVVSSEVRTQEPVEAVGVHYVPFVRSLEEFSFKSIVTPPQSLCEDYTIVLIAVSCSVESFHYREAIRQTWGTAVKNPQLGVKIIFNLAEPVEKFKHLQREISQEAELNQDILQWDFLDDHRNLTLKSVALFQWVRSECPRVKFLMKTDDDVFLNVQNLLQLLVKFIHAKQDKNMMLGYRIDNAKPGHDRNSKWYTSAEIYRDRVYPTYLSGSAYVVSMDIIGAICDGAEKTPPFWLEDVYITGILRSSLGVTLVHHEGFWYRRRKSGVCEYRTVITGHELSAEELYKVWHDLKRPELDCTTVARKLWR